MPGRVPGPLCATTAERIDAGTNCRAATPRPGPTGTRAASAASGPHLSFDALWQHYPSSHPYVDAKGDTPKGYDNQCAIKVSAALVGAGFELRGFNGAAVSVGGKRHAARAQELAAWLDSKGPDGLKGHAQVITGADWETKIKGRTGIVYFADYWLREGEKTPSGDHIDLWNGSRLTASGLAGWLTTTARFTFGMSTGPGFSDLGKAKKILFWSLP